MHPAPTHMHTRVHVRTSISTRVHIFSAPSPSLPPSSRPPLTHPLFLADDSEQKRKEKQDRKVKDEAHKLCQRLACKICHTFCLKISKALGTLPWSTGAGRERECVALIRERVGEGVGQRQTDKQTDRQTDRQSNIADRLPLRGRDRSIHPHTLNPLHTPNPLHLKPLDPTR